LPAPLFVNPPLPLPLMFPLAATRMAAGVLKVKAPGVVLLMTTLPGSEPGLVEPLPIVSWPLEMVVPPL